MSLADSFEELETLDMPRGVVKAANLHAAKCVPIVELVQLAKEAPDAEVVMAQGRRAYKDSFDSFIEGARWAKGMKPFARSINLEMCDDFAHVIKSDSNRCQCGEKKRE